LLIGTEEAGMLHLSFNLAISLILYEGKVTLTTLVKPFLA